MEGYIELYIDVVFLVSFGMHVFLLWAAGRIAGFSAKKWRIAAASFLSAVLYCFWFGCFYQNGGFLLSQLLLWLGLVVSYYPKQGRNWLRLFGAAWAASFLMGGGIQVLFSMTEAQRFLGKGLVLGKPLPWQFLPWSVGMAYVLLKLAGKWLEANIIRRREYCTAAVLWRGRGIEGHLLIDTGNGMKEKGRGTAIFQLSALLPLFFREEQIKLLSGNREGLEWAGFHSLGNPNGKLWGIRAERLVLSFGEKQIVHRDIFVGINEMDFTGAYEGIVPPCLLEEE